MDSRNISKHHQLANLVSEKIVGQLSFTFDFTDYHYNSISDELKIIIQNECVTTLTSFTPSKTQSDILNQADLGKLADLIAGTLTRANTFNIVTGNGFTMTGLTKTYFDALSCKVGMFVNDLINPLNPKMADLWYEEYNGKRYETVTYDELKGDKMVRQKKILSFFGEQLLLLATQEQTLNLCNEIKEKDNGFVLALRTPRGLSSLMNNEANTNSFVTYENQLFTLSCSANLIVKLVKSLVESMVRVSLRIDSSHHTAFSFFTSKERNQLVNVLPRLNKEMLEAEKSEINAFRKTFKRV